MLNRNKITKDEFHNLIEEMNNITIQKAITNELYDIVGTWQNFFGKSVYVIGLSDDRYDYYYIGITENEYRLNFTTCLCKPEPSPNISKKWNKDEKKLILSMVKQYFTDHENKEKIIYLSI